jgi:dihydroflavonol-4-reductase
LILITGINGFIGSRIALLLVERGFKVRGTVRANSRLANLEAIRGKIELVECDIRSLAALERAFEGVDTCYHMAALVKTGRHSTEEYFSTNLHGTMNVCSVAMKAGVKKFVHISTMETLRPPSPLAGEGRGEGALIDESVRNSYADMIGDYGRSKFLAEEHVKACSAVGLEAVIVNPTAVIGPHDVNGTPPVTFIKAYARGRIPFYFETGFNMVDVRDVARGALLAAEKGKIGERYILGNDNIMLSKIFELTKKLSGKRPFSVRLPYGLASMVAKFFVRNKNFTERITASKRPFFVSCARAKKELHYKPVFDIKTAIEDTLW